MCTYIAHIYVYYIAHTHIRSIYILHIHTRARTLHIYIYTCYIYVYVQCARFSFALYAILFFSFSYSRLHGVLRICSGYYFVLNFWTSPTFNPPVLIVGFEWFPVCTCWIFESLLFFFGAALFAGLWWFAEGTILRWNVESVPPFFAGSLRGVQLSIIFESLHLSYFFFGSIVRGILTSCWGHFFVLNLLRLVWVWDREWVRVCERETQIDR